MTDHQSPWLTQDEVLFHRMVAFHRQRVEAIASGASPHLKKDARILIVHLIPQECVQKRIVFDGLKLQTHGNRISPLGRGGWSSRFNVDGFMNFYDQDEIRALSQLFRDGRLEAATADLVEEGNGTPFIHGTVCEQAFFDIASTYLEFCRKIGLNAPIWMFSAFVGCQGVRIASGRSFMVRDRLGIDRSPAFLPETEIDSLDIKPATFLRPLCDALWQSAGLERSPNYDEQGNWREGR